MHPDLMRELANQRGCEMRTRAREARLVRGLRKALRERRISAKASDMPIAPRIPDYVDGTFRETERAA
jgi:hypothetical protein